MQLFQRTSEVSLEMISLQLNTLNRNKNSTKDKPQTNSHAIDMHFQIKQEQIKSSNLF